MVWPDHIASHRRIESPCCSADYFVTILDILGYTIPEELQRPYDGISLMPLIDGASPDRPRPIAFESTNQQVALSDNRYKIYRADETSAFELYDLVEDRSETHDIASEHPDLVETMSQKLSEWRESCRESRAGKDYR